MKDQYFGDFGDYQKISLLNKLHEGRVQTTVYWMKTKDDDSTDGKHITYLQKPDVWSMYEPNIFSFLNKKVTSEKRSLTHIEKSLFCQGIHFINKYIEDRTVRDQILKTICEVDTSELLFFDPDNGIEVVSINKKNIHKYVTWHEIINTFTSGKSVLIYQHFSRVNRNLFIKNKKG